MPALPIVTGDKTPILRHKTKRVPKVTKEIVTLVRDMAATVAKAQGAGLAAPQVGRSERVCLALIDGTMEPLINPEIVWKSEATSIAEEGCLSLPDLWIPVPRSNEIIVKFLSVDGKPRELKLSAFDARVVQHEVDHLEGVLIVDYLQQN